MMLIKPMLDEYVAGLEKNWIDERHHTVGAPEVGQCIRKTWFVKHADDPDFGFTQDPNYVDRWGAKMRGTVIEDEFWYPAVKAGVEKFGGQLLLAGPDQKTLYKDYLSATPDGLVIPKKGNCFVVECKSMDPRTNTARLPKLEHTFQVQIQLGLIREIYGEEPGYKPDYGILTYTDASWWDEVQEFTIEFDPAVYEQAKVRAEMIMTTDDPFHLEQEGVIAGGVDCEYCQFVGACRKTQVDIVKGLPETTSPSHEEIDEMQSIVVEYRIAKEVADEADQNKKRLEAKVKGWLRDHEKRNIAANDFVVSWSTVAGRQSWSINNLVEAAKEAGVDIEPFRREGNPYDRLTIK